MNSTYIISAALRIFVSLVLSFLWIGAAQALTYADDSDVVGEISYYTVQPNDNLYKIARQFDLGIVEILAANPGVDPWMPAEGTELVLPTMHILPDVEHRGIVINLSELRLYYFPDALTVMTFPIGTGREGWQTPVGKTFVADKRKNPAWIPPPSIRKENPNLPEIFPPGPDNPLGEYALDLEWKGYRIHGTNRPYGIGSRSSHGCIRLYPEDIAVLFPLIKNGTPVTVVDDPYRLGWEQNRLWLQITPTQQQADTIAEYHVPDAIDIPGIYKSIEQVAGTGTEIDWYAVETATMQRDGIPVIVATKDNP